MIPLKKTPALPRAIIAALAVFAIASPHCAADPAHLLRPGDHVAVCGDSITEQKRYSIYMELYLMACQPASNLEMVQFGWNGDTTWGFLERIPQNVGPFAPQVATTLYGMNDGGYLAANKAADRIQRFRTSLEGMVKSFRDIGVREIIIASPPPVDPATFKRNTPEAYNPTLALLGDIARDVAEKNKVQFADVNGVMTDAMKRAKAAKGWNYQVAGDDGVHPGSNGHLIIAYTLLKALGCDGNIGTFTWNCATGRAQATDGHRVIDANTRALEIESTRYPYCFPEDPQERAPTARSILDIIPFNEELNRLMLVVKNAPAQKMRVTWGEHSRVYTAAELEKGINLAADFLDNPFCENFARVIAAARIQQDYETDGVRILLHSLNAWAKHFPDEAKLDAPRRRMVVQKAADYYAATKSLLTPVKHTVQISPVK